ncbi:ABC transporter permease [Effusibacillus consociatus]|uniref:ABC transporter permease n=1 Tax=Effusibacillus consociatus TaxID=1117041 RepID=A0ABV9Q0A4_9BACL
MSFFRVLQVECLKLKRSKIFLLVLLGPFLILSMQFLNFTLRYNLLVKPGKSEWWEFIQEVGSFWGVLVLPIIVAIVAGMINAVEHSSNAWKYVLTMPIKRRTIYLGKLLLTFLLSVSSSIILTIGLVITGKALGFKEAIPWGKIGELFLYPLLGIIAISAIQVWLSTRLHNFSIAVGIGIGSVVISLFMSQSMYTHWFPWVYPFMTAPIEDNQPTFYSIVSVCVGIAMTLLGMWEFERRDV